MGNFFRSRKATGFLNDFCPNNLVGHQDLIFHVFHRLA